MALDPNELFPEIPNLYEFPSIHRDMISDEKRVNAYKSAIERTVRQGDVVVDVGTGTGLLAFLCLQAGAKRVHAIDRSPVIECARELAEANGFLDRILFHNEDARTAEIGEHADIVVSELIGHIAFEEGMVESLFEVKRRLLAPNGTMIPASVALYAAPVVERDAYTTCIDGWGNIHGIDYAPMRARALKNAYVTQLRETDLVAPPQVVFAVDFSEGLVPELKTKREYTVHRAGAVNGLALWFDAYLTADVRLSSGPWTKTHWKQCFVPIPNPIHCNVDDRIDATMSMHLRSGRNDLFRFEVDISNCGRRNAKKQKSAYDAI